MPATSTGQPQNDPYLGIECTVDADCGPQGTCISADKDDPVLGGGAANGYCTRPCRTDGDCPGAASLCLVYDQTTGDGECFLGCDFGVPEREYVDSELDPLKCRGREDLRCERVQDIPVCLPTCGRDAQCGTRQCDQQLGFCVDAARSGLPDGSPCDPESTTPECEGACISFTDGSVTCASVCVLGGDLLETNDCGGINNGLCAYAPSVNGVGDYGYCAHACNAQTDCAQPNFWCFGFNFSQAGIENGYCFGATECPGGQTDCQRSEQVCTETPYGPFCLEERFPYEGGGGAGGADPTTGSGGASSTSGTGGSGGG